MLKKEIRALALSRRDAIPLEARELMDKKVLELIAAMDEYIEADRILLYASYRSEAGTMMIIEHALSAGKEVVLPRVDEDKGCLTKHVISSLSDIGEGFKGIPEPVTDVCVRVEDVDLIIVPGVAFSPQGARIGYGGGYYDRLLPRVKGTRPIVALAYEEQIFPEIPAEGHDIGMDTIVTPERIISCNG